MPKSVYNPEPTPKFDPSSAPPQARKQEFARRLQALRVAKGWTQSDLARRAFGGGKEAKGRDNISGYERAMRLPTPTMLKKMADALGVTTEELLPSGVRSSVEETLPAFDVRATSSDADNVWLRVNQSVPWDRAIKIMQILKGQDD